MSSIACIHLLNACSGQNRTTFFLTRIPPISTNLKKRISSVKIRAIRVFFPLRLRAFALKIFMLVFLNGQFVTEAQAVVPINDRGFMYGDGLFETVRVVNGRPFRLAQHLERMMRGADFLKIKCPFTAKDLRDFAGQLIGKNKTPDAILRVTLTRGPGERGYTPKTDGKPTVVMTLHAAPPVVNRIQWTLAVSSFRVPAKDPLASFKTLNKLTHVMARMEAVEKGVDEALLLNTNGEVAETASGNLFWVSRSQVCTVPIGCGVLPGITRAVVLEICRTLGLQTHERVIKPGALRNAEGIFITQSVSGIVPLTALDGEPVASSPLMDQIRRAYCEMLNQA
jgi:branched-chain amino acid aminotransferase